jgi:hypothetical protein
MPTCRRPAVQHSGQHIKNIVLAHLSGKRRLARLATIGAGVGYLHIMCLIGFFVEHACMSQGKKCEANL